MAVRRVRGGEVPEVRHHRSVAVLACSLRHRIIRTTPVVITLITILTEVRREVLMVDAVVEDVVGTEVTISLTMATTRIITHLTVAALITTVEVIIITVEVIIIVVVIIITTIVGRMKGNS